MRRREFIAGLGGAMAWPLAAVQVIATPVLTSADIEHASTSFARAPNGGFILLDSSFTILHHSLIADLASRYRLPSIGPGPNFAKDGGVMDYGPNPDLVSHPATAALQRQTRTIPIIFVLVSDPIGSGFVASLSRPGGNITGFMLQEAGLAGKWLELLTEIAPAVRRTALMFNPDTAPFVRSYYLPQFEAAARSLKLAPIAAPDTDLAATSKKCVSTPLSSINRDDVA
jgi:putative tryptophan/tyrosine transport system substrate-binding protein